MPVIDTRVRRASRTAAEEHSPVKTAASVISSRDFVALGALLSAAHQVQPGDDMQPLALSAALGAGALGGRAIADGEGRPVCVLAEVDRVAAVRAAVSAELTRHGDRAPRCLTFTPRPGAAPLDTLAPICDRPCTDCGAGPRAGRSRRCADRGSSPGR